MSSRRTILQTGVGLLPVAALGATDRPGTNLAREQQSSCRPICVRDFGARGDGTTDDTAAIQRAIDEAEKSPEGKNPPIYLPAGEYIVSSTLHVRKDGMQIHGDGLGTWIRPIISNGTACIKIAAGTSHWLIDNIRIEATIASEPKYLSGASSAQPCIGLEAFQTGSNFITRFRIGFVRIKNCAVGVRLGGFVATVDDLLVVNCNLGMEGAILNDVVGVFRFENCRKSFAVVDSFALRMHLLDEGTAALTQPATIDGGGGISVSAYWEWDTNPRNSPFLVVGGKKEVTDFEFSGSVGASGTGVYSLKLDRVNGANVRGGFALGVRKCALETTPYTRNLSVGLSFNHGAALQDGSRQLGVAYNYFPNCNFDIWFRGWKEVFPSRVSLSRETLLVRKGANAVKLTCSSGQSQNMCSWRIAGPSVIALRGKAVVMGVWMWIPDHGSFDNAQPAGLPGPVLKSFNGTAFATSIANNNRAVRDAWNFLICELTVQPDATQIHLEVYANHSQTRMSASEYVVVDSIVLCEKSTPLRRIYNGELVDSPQIDSVGVAGRMITHASEPPNDQHQVFEAGDQVFSTSPGGGKSPGWVCTKPGTGTMAVFKQMAPLTG